MCGDFKEIILSYNEALNAGDMKAINLFNAEFKPSELVLKQDSNKVIVLLKEVDIDLLKSTANKCSGYTDKHIFDDVVTSIEQIKSYGIKGKKRNYVDYNKERKVKDRGAKEKQRGQYYYAQDNKFSKINNILPEKYSDKIICEDSLSVLKELPDNCIDLVFTSPPYNFGLEYSDNHDAHFWDDYFKKLFEIFQECIRVVKYGGRIIINIQPLFSDYIPSHHIISNFFIQNKLIWKGEILWEKNNYNCKYTAWGSWKSPSNPYLKYTWELIEVFCKGELKKTGSSDKADISPDEFKKWVVGKWSIAPERRMKEFGHPAMFPEELVARVIKLFSFQDDIILDPFNGVGTTSLVACKFNRRYLGIDISKDYCETAQTRLKELKLKEGLLTVRTKIPAPLPIK